MKTRDLQTALNMARRLFNKLDETCERPGCFDTGCPFTEHICMDVDTVVTQLEAYLEKEE
jgi:hypothetical protein